MIRAIILLAFLWFGCVVVLVTYADGLYLHEKAERERATARAMIYASLITVIVALLWWTSTLPPTTGGTWPEP